MGRSLKKGPFADPKLLDKVDQLNEKGEKRIIKPGLAVLRFFRRSLGTHLLSMMAGSMFQFL